MAREAITGYNARWDLNSHHGYLWLWRRNGGNFQQRIESPAEFSAIIDLLRNEKPIFFDTSDWSIHVGREPVGEGE